MKAARKGFWWLRQAQALLFNQLPNVKIIVVQSSDCCSVVSVNTSNTVQPLTFGYSNRASCHSGGDTRKVGTFDGRCTGSRPLQQLILGLFFCLMHRPRTW